MSGRLHHRGLWVVGVAAFLVATWLGNRQPAEARVERGVYPIVVPGLTYLGNSTCAGAECHTADKPKEQSGQLIGDEAAIWAEADPHALAYETLGSEDSKKIATGLKIADAMASSRCLTCHAMDAPPEQRGEKFALTNAVGCESCHGPAQKWNEPHKKAGWTLGERKAIGPQGLSEKYGLMDTSHLAVRAHTCVACHMQIDKDMIDAGHPPLEFELYAYNYYVSKKPDKEYKVHWGDGLVTPAYWDAKLWAAGQAAAHEAASAQVAAWKAKGWDTADAEALEQLYAGGLAIVRKHFGVDTAADVVDAKLTPETVVAAAGELSRLPASTQVHRRIVAHGVAALTSTAYAESDKDLPEPFWDDYYAALGAEDDAAFRKALDAMKAVADAVK